MKATLIIISLMTIINLVLGQKTFDYNNDFIIILEQSQDKKSDYYFPSLLGRFYENDTTLSDYEVLALLIGFTNSKYYIPYGYKKIETQIKKLCEVGKYKNVISKSDSLLPLVPLSLYAIYYRSVAFNQLGNTNAAQSYYWKAYKIFKAMTYSGKGRNIENAMFSLGPYDCDLYTFFHLRKEILSTGTNYDSNGNFITILRIDKSNDKKDYEELFFNINHAYDSHDNSENYMKYFSMFESK